MHELSIAMSIVDMAQEEAERHGGVQVQAVHLKLGRLAGVVKEALFFLRNGLRSNPSGRLAAFD